MTKLPLARMFTNFLTCQIYRVKGQSMVPTLLPGYWVLVSRVAYRIKEPQRGDMIIARDPGHPHHRYLKRVIGLPGEEVAFMEGMLFVDGEHLAEPYLGGLPASPGLNSHSWQLEQGMYFVAGDNRAHSSDSREYGPVSLEQVVGKVWFCLWPPGRFGRQIFSASLPPATGQFP